MWLLKVILSTDTPYPPPLSVHRRLHRIKFAYATQDVKNSIRYKSYTKYFGYFAIFLKTYSALPITKWSFILILIMLVNRNHATEASRLHPSPFFAECISLQALYGPVHCILAFVCIVV